MPFKNRASGNMLWGGGRVRRCRTSEWGGGFEGDGWVSCTSTTRSAKVDCQGKQREASKAKLRAIWYERRDNFERALRKGREDRLHPDGQQWLAVNNFMSSFILSCPKCRKLAWNFICASSQTFGFSYGRRLFDNHVTLTWRASINYKQLHNECAQGFPAVPQVSLRGKTIQQDNSSVIFQADCSRCVGVPSS